MGGLIMGMIASVCWKEGIPKQLSRGPKPHYAHKCEHDLAQLWTWVCQPLLFGVIGCALDFRQVQASTIPKAIGLTLLGLCIRLPVAFLATLGKGATEEEALTTQERLFVALSWTPKATVQAALCSSVLDAVENNMHGSSDYDEYYQWGQDVLTTAVLSILLTAPLGLAATSSTPTVTSYVASAPSV